MHYFLYFRLQLHQIIPCAQWELLTMRKSAEFGCLMVKVSQTWILIDLRSKKISSSDQSIDRNERERRSLFFWEKVFKIWFHALIKTFEFPAKGKYRIMYKNVLYLFSVIDESSVAVFRQYCLLKIICLYALNTIKTTTKHLWILLCELITK